MLARDAIRARLNRVFQDVFDDETIQITDATTADDLDEWDSLSHVTLVLTVEREFGIKLKAAEVGNLANVGAMMDLIASRTES